VLGRLEEVPPLRNVLQVVAGPHPAYYFNRGLPVHDDASGACRTRAGDRRSLPQACLQPPTGLTPSSLFASMYWWREFDLEPPCQLGEAPEHVAPFRSDVALPRQRYSTLRNPHRTWAPKSSGDHGAAARQQQR
jgi:hypothetical protein